VTEPAGARPASLTELIGEVGREAHRPVLVCHLSDGARTELSGASLANWTAKVAGLLRDELVLGPGDVAAVRARTGWQLAPVLLGCWWTGLTVTGADAPAGHDPSVAFVDPGDDADADEQFVLSGHPLGAPATDVADHQRDFTTAVLPQSDQPGAAAVSGGGWIAARTAKGPVTADELLRAAQASGDHLAVAERPVLLSTRDWTVPTGVASTLLACLVAGGTVVQCAADLPADRLAGIARSERATATTGVEIAGLAPL